MTKQEFLAALRQGLSGLPEADIERSVEFYAESIDDRIEDGMTEEQATEAIGTVEDAVAQILRETPMTKIVREKVKPHRALAAWEIVLLVLGSPVWFSLLIAAFAVMLSVYISVWAVIVSLWATFGSLVGCAFGVVVGGIALACMSNVFSGVALICAGAVCAGLSIFAFFGCRAATGGILWLTKRMALEIKFGLLRGRRTE